MINLFLTANAAVQYKKIFFAHIASLQSLHETLPKY